MHDLIKSGIVFVSHPFLSFLIEFSPWDQQADNIIVRIANIGDIHFSKIITDEMEASAKARGTGIAKRNPEYIENKIPRRQSCNCRYNRQRMGWLLLY